MALRIIKDVLGDVSKDGAVIHRGVRIMLTGDGRVGVVDGKGTKAPEAVYAASEVTYTTKGACTPCQGYPSRTAMVRAWQKSEAEAHAV